MKKILLAMFLSALTPSFVVAAPAGCSTQDPNVPSVDIASLPAETQKILKEDVSLEEIKSS